MAVHSREIQRKWYCMLIDIIYNIALLLAVSLFFVTYPFKQLHKEWWFRTLMGLAIGTLGLLVMSRPAVLMQGIVFDGRTILLGVSGMFFGPVETIIASVLMICYRILMGGGGVYTGVATIVFAAAIGSIWHRVRYNRFMASSSRIALELYLVGLTIHLFMLASMLLMPAGQRAQIFRYLTLPILLVYPLGSYLLSTLLYSQLHRMKMVDQLAMSERRFKTMFEQAPMGITVTDSASGKAIEVNRKFLRITGWDGKDYTAVSWMEITHPDDLEEDRRQMERLLRNEIDSYELDKRIRRQDGSYVWVSMAITLLHSSDETPARHLCMVTDITARKEMEQAILYANTHDPLTDLYNRTMFERLLAKHDTQESYPLAILIGDVNGLKIVNDAFGREAGDSLLITIAQEMAALAEGKGWCARIGGDEFAFILPHSDETAAWELASAVQNRRRYGVRSVDVTISFGVGVKNTADEDINDVVKHAENTLNRSKLSESPSARSKAVHTIINTLHEKNRREELHSRRVSVLGVRLAEVLGMSAKEVAELRTIGLLHDIGKIAIDGSILNKEGPLNEQEWEAMRRHPETGWRILGTVGELGELANFILAHHERPDGTGYPQGLKGDEIPLQSRIIAIVDAYDAMTAVRTYREPVGDRQAATELKKYAGTQFDAGLARLFVEHILQLDWNEL